MANENDPDVPDYEVHEQIEKGDPNDKEQIAEEDTEAEAT